MGLTVTLQGEDGAAIETVEDPSNLLHAVLTGEPGAGLPWAETIDWYGDTTFNHIQAGRLREEWARLLAVARDRETVALLRQIDGLLQSCATGVHLHVKFWGD